jgi:hypothetical protein
MHVRMFVLSVCKRSHTWQRAYCTSNNQELRINMALHRRTVSDANACMRVEIIDSSSKTIHEGSVRTLYPSKSLEQKR